MALRRASNLCYFFTADRHSGAAMKKSVKALLISGLVFPGTGHFSLERYQRGLLFFLPAALSILYLIRYSLDKAYTIAEQIQLGQIPLDTVVITNLIAAQPGGAEWLKLKIATWIFIFCWVVSMIDSFRLGKIADQSDSK